MRNWSRFLIILNAKILLGDYNANVGRENICKPTIWNESLHKCSNDNGVRIVKLATSEM